MQAPQCGPSRVDLVVLMLRVVVQPCTAHGAEAKTVVLAHRLQGQGEHHGVPQNWPEVDELVLHLRDLFRIRSSGVGVGKELLNVEVKIEYQGIETTHTLTACLRPTTSGHQHPLDDRLEPQLQLDRRTFRDTHHVRAESGRRIDRAVHLSHRPWAPRHRLGVENQQVTRVEARHERCSPGAHRSTRIGEMGGVPLGSPDNGLGDETAAKGSRARSSAPNRHRPATQPAYPAGWRGSALARVPVS